MKKAMPSHSSVPYAHHLQPVHCPVLDPANCFVFIRVRLDSVDRFSEGALELKRTTTTGTPASVEQEEEVEALQAGQEAQSSSLQQA